MITRSELARIRRVMHQRIRETVAERRLAAAVRGGDDHAADLGAGAEETAGAGVARR